MVGGGGDVDAAIAALRERTDGPLYALVAFDPDEFEVLYVPDQTADPSPDAGVMLDDFECVFDYVGIDFAERALFSDGLLPDAGSVTAMTTCLEAVKIVRAYGDGTAGVFLAVAPDEPVPPLLDAVSDHLL
jgi:hypothetical protein